MKKFLIFFVLVWSSWMAFGQTQSTTTVPAPTPYSIISRSANSRVWERTTYEVSPSGQTIPHVHHYTELASGLCYQQNGQWIDSQEQINILPDGSAAATKGQHQAYFPPDIYNGVIKLVTPDGLTLQSQPVGLSYDDGTNTVLIAVLTNSVGQLISSNQVIYTNAFIGVDADLLYTYKKSGFEQDVIFRQQPPAPEEFGIDSANSRLQMLTEFFDTPAPSESVGPANDQNGLQDTTLRFGKMEMTPGKAFLTGTNSQNFASRISVYKKWIIADGRAFLTEEVPYQQISAQLASLPLPSAGTISAANSLLHKVSTKRQLPRTRLPKTMTNSTRLAIANLSQSPGLVLDYVTMDIDVTNFTFQGDTTYYVSDEYGCWGTTIFEGGTVIKIGLGWLDIDDLGTNGAIDCQTGSYRPAFFTSWNDNSLGETISGSSGDPSWTDVSYFLNINATNDIYIQNARFSFCYYGIVTPDVTPDFLEVRDCQFNEIGYDAICEYNMELLNVLVNSSYNGFTFYGSSFVAEQVTANTLNSLIVVASSASPVVAWTNCLWTSPNYSLGGRNHLLFVDNVLNPHYQHATVFTNDVECLLDSPIPVYQTAGGGSYYLTNDSPYRGVGSTNIDPTLLAELQTKTTWPPVVYAGTNISSLGTLSPAVSRDIINSSLGLGPDLGYHYDPLDYLFAGCDLYSNLTFTTGTAVGWYERYGTLFGGEPYSISLNDGANVSFVGNATEPCVYARSAMVQEGGNWNYLYPIYPNWLASIIFNGSGNPPVPQLAADFTKWSVDNTTPVFCDDWSNGIGFFENCEFYNAGISSYDLESLDFTNCLFFRNLINFSDEYTNTSFIFQNCTFYNGGLAMARTSAYPASNWQIEDTSFDGTDFCTNDYWNGTAYTTFNYNAYNTNNLNWTNYAYLNPPTNGFLETIGAQDIMVTNFNWETNWFGDFYLPTNSPLLQMGSTYATNLGLYHFTTETNQVVDGTNIVTIGYHYVATGTNGVPLDSNGDGIPDYIEDANGNGLDDSGEIGWNITNDLGLTVIITKPPNNSIIP